MDDRSQSRRTHERTFFRDLLGGCITGGIIQPRDRMVNIPTELDCEKIAIKQIANPELDTSRDLHVLFLPDMQIAKKWHSSRHVFKTGLYQSPRVPGRRTLKCFQRPLPQELIPLGNPRGFVCRNTSYSGRANAKECQFAAYNTCQKERFIIPNPSLPAVGRHFMLYVCNQALVLCGNDAYAGQYRYYC